MIAVSDGPTVTEAILHWRSRNIMPTGMSSAELQELGREVRMRAVFSARMTNAEAVQGLADTVDEILTGKINMATGVLRMYEKLQGLGYKPESGFPEDTMRVPPAEEGSLQDLMSEGRIRLMLETNARMAAGYGRMVEGNRPYALREYPAFELIRLYWRKVERGSQESESAGWQERWQDAGDSVDWTGAIEDPMMARKDSPVWQALGDGAGGYRDALGNPYEPYAFGSGMGRRPVARKEWEELSDDDQGSGPGHGSLVPSASELETMFDRLAPDLRATLEGKWAA